MPKHLATTSLIDYRSQWPWAKPFALALDTQGKVIELVAYPYDENGTACVMARAVVNDPTSLRQYLMEDIRDIGWPQSLQSKYREGFIDGWAAAVRQMRLAKEGE